MRIVSLAPTPFFELPCRIVDSAKRIRAASFPFLRGTISQLPEGIEALFVASDLQAREQDETANRLLGEVVAGQLPRLVEAGEMPPLERVGVILAGDLFVPPLLDRRGGLGDVSHIWRAFASRCAWVVGVAGNHDEPLRLDDVSNAHELDGGSVTLGRWRMAGLGGIIGKPTRPRRRSPDEYCRLLHDLLREQPDLLILHQGPSVPGEKHSGDRSVRLELERSGGSLTICGHTHWHRPLAQLPNRRQVLNVDDRAVLLTRAER